MSHSDERRRLPRRRTRLSAAAVFGADDRVVLCSIRDKSESGARLLAEQSSEIPDAFSLIELSTGLRHEAQVVWRDDAFLGVAIRETVPLSRAATSRDRRLAALRAKLTQKGGLRRQA